MNTFSRLSSWRAAQGASVVLLVTLASACSTPLRKDTPDSASTAPAASQPAPAQDSGPPATPRPELANVPDAVPKAEPIPPGGPNKQYVTNGVTYLPDVSNRPFQQRGLASWYGEKFHGKRTANGETYDMYAMSAAHTTLPLPSYARVTHLGSGKSVVVRINDRGPFIAGRVIDLSYAAAHKLGMVSAGQADVLIERVFAADAPVSPFPSAAGAVAASAPVAASSPVATAQLPPPLSTERPRAIAPPTGKEIAAAPARGMMLQAGAFSLAENAQKMAAQLRQALPDLADRTVVETALIKGKNLFRVVVGAFSDEAERSNAAARIEKVTGSPAGLR
jgi:rare lipoprotein A